ncbi:MAG: GTP cyclohydrolase FolE2 [Thermoanaerobaculia bacterium]|nr:GTP cyclohydrolase FolE2 [Thermoanaerobaculia bacterium]
MTTVLDTAKETPEKTPARLADVQSSRDRRDVKIDKVGVKNIEYPIVVKDRADGTQATIGTINMYVDLPAHFKGTHMSRFLEALNAHEGPIGVDEIPDILEAMRTRLEAETAHFFVTFPYFMEKRAPVTGARGMMPYVCGFDACAGECDDFIVSVEVPVTTLCPCSKEIASRGAHNQRGVVRLQVRFEGELWLEELIELVEESASCDLFPVLKRPDEKFVTEKAYDNPRFVEDLSREVTLRLREDPRILWFSVEVENFESIHAHNAYAAIEQWREDYAS